MTVLGSRRSRGLLWQALALAAVIAAAAYLVDTAIDNMARRGIRSGFGFLGATAGFDIIQTLTDYDAASTYARAFLVGLLNTLLVSAIGIVCATILGVAIGIGRLSRNWLVARLCAVYVETVRNVPLLLQLFIWYFAVLRTLPPARNSLEIGGIVFLNLRGLYVPRPEADGLTIGLLIAALALAAVGVALRMTRPRHKRPVAPAYALGGLALTALAISLLGLRWDLPELAGFNFRGGLVVIPELAALAVALSTYTAAFIAENVRAGINAVPTGQTEAGRALGLSEGRILRRIVLPQAVRVVVPPVTNQYLNLTKNSSLAAAIAYPDLVSVFAGTVLNQTGQAIEVIAITMSVYLSLSLAIAAAMNLYNRRVMQRVL